MKLDLRPMLRGEQSVIPIEFSFVYNDIDYVTVTGDVNVSGNITDNAGYMQLLLRISFDYQGECARCLTPLSGSFDADFERTVVDEGTLTNEQPDDNIDEYVIIKDGFLDIDEQLREAILFEFPRKLLCSENCPGLCPKCGKPLKDGECKCQKSEPDPRWAVLKEYSDKLKDK